jgi:DNA-binding transcriptional regulator YbjK
MALLASLPNSTTYYFTNIDLKLTRTHAEFSAYNPCNWFLCHIVHK